MANASKTTNNINESIHLVDEENKNVFYTKEVYDLKNYIVNNVSKDVIKICDYVSQGLYVFCNAYNGIHEMLEEMAQEQGLVDSFNDVRYVAYTGTTEDDDYETIDYSDGIVYDYGDFKIFEVTQALGKSKFIGSRLQRALGQFKRKYRLVNGSFRKDEALNESTGFPITVYTYQKPQVRELLERGETYIADYSRANYNHYKDLAKVLGLNNCPIFGALSKDDLYDMLDSSGIDFEEENIIHLEIPKENLKYTEYYDWTDYMYALDDPESFREESSLSIQELEDLLKTQKGASDYENCQVVFDRIEPKWYQDGKDEDALNSESDDEDDFNSDSDSYEDVEISQSQPSNEEVKAVEEPKQEEAKEETIIPIGDILQNNASTDSQVPSAKAVYDALQEGGGGGGVPPQSNT